MRMKLPLVLLASGMIGTAAPVITAIAAPAPTQAPSAAAPGWPRDVTSQGVLLTIYQPQVDAWENSRLLKARAAFVMTPGKGKPVIGVMEIEGATATNLETRTVRIGGIKLTSVRFPSLPEPEVPPTEALFRKVFPRRTLSVSLDRLSAGLEHQARPLTLRMDPPRIVMSPQPAALLLVEGKPVLAPAGKGEFVVNANWDLFFDRQTSLYHLLCGDFWYNTRQFEGPWNLSGELPAFLSHLPEGNQWEHVKKQIPPRLEEARKRGVPQIVFSDVPAELIVFGGTPVWEEVPGTGLSAARNTESHVFRLGKTLYFLTSGRWFRAPGWEGPWSYAGNDLPEDFRRLPRDGDYAEVLAAVPGTPEAADAVLLASIPREAVVKVREAEAKAKAVYGGEPVFAPIEGTPMAYATNTSADVIRLEQKYYLCQNGVWFVSGTPGGPWVICTSVPAVIYTIPPSYPVHRVVYVTTGPGESADVVVCSYTSGYEGAYVAGVATGAVLVWGTGYYYPPYVVRGGAVPVYYPWPATYGTAAVYTANGTYAVGGRYYGPYGSTGSAAWYNPQTGNYGRAARVTTPYGSSTWAAGYNPRTDTAWATQQNYNGYSQWGTSAVERGDDWLRTGHVVNENGGAVAWQGSEGGGHAWKTENHSGGTAHHDGDFYAGHDGNVYRRDEDGNWAKYDDGDWNSVEGPERPDNSSKSDTRSREQENPQSASGRSTGDEATRRSTAEERTAREPRRTGETTGENRRAQTPGTESAQSTQSAGDRTRQNRESLQSGDQRFSQQRAQRDEYLNREASRPASREPSREVSRQLGRDAANRREGISREQRQRPEGGGFRGGGREGGRRR